MICQLCESDFTEGGDRLCDACRREHGEDDNRIDNAIAARAYTASVRRRSLEITGSDLILALSTKPIAAE